MSVHDRRNPHYAPAFRQVIGSALPVSHRRVLSAIESCRTSALGGHVDRCNRCGHQAISYNSCRNRHCPKCQGAARRRWLEARCRELLPLPYFHVVFTLPPALADLALQNKRVVYGILFRATAETLLTIGQDPRHLGAQLGFFAILHTWGQNLLHHPHLHCVVPGGGLSTDRSRFIKCRPGFFLPVRVLSRLFRRLFLTALRLAFEQGRLQFRGSLADRKDPVAFDRLLHELGRIEWVVYAKPPFGGPEQVLRYLGRYTHRVALTNGRLLNIDGGRVRFSYKDYRLGHHNRHMTLDAHEFIRRSSSTSCPIAS